MRRTLKLLLFITVMMLTAGNAFAVTDGELVVNGDFEGSDFSSFCLNDEHRSITEDDIVVEDGSRCLKVVSRANAENAWDTQFFIKLPEGQELIPGQKVSFNMRIKANMQATIHFEGHKTPSDFLWYDFFGYYWYFSSQWLSISHVYTVPEDIASEVGAIAIDLNCDLVNSIEFYIDDISLVIGKKADIDGLSYLLDKDNGEAMVISSKNSPSGNIVIPESVVYNGDTYNVSSIGYKAFQNCSNITSVTIPYSVTSIGKKAFDGCSGLSSISIPNYVTYIGELAFNNCSGLTSVILPSYLTSIGTALFQNCINLTSVNIPNTVETIGTCAFAGCESLPSINIPNSVTTIETAAFQACSSLTSVTIPNSVTNIKGGTFQGCSSLTSITIPSSVTSIASYAFNNCSSITSITIPKSVTSIGEGAFRECTGLTEIHSLIEKPFAISNSVFGHWDDNTQGFVCLNPRLYVPVGSKADYMATDYWSEFDDIVEMPSLNIDFSDANVKAVCVDNWDTNGDGELSYNEAATVTDLGTVFMYNSSIRSFDELQYFTGLTTIGENAFFNSGIASVTIPSSVTSIGSEAFSWCYYLSSITIPSGVTSIDLWAFEGCSRLETIIVDSENPVYDSRDNCNAIIETASNTLVSGCQNTIIPNSVTGIGDYAFYDCYNLTSVTIPSSITSIGYGAFRGCYNLTSIIVDADNPVYDSRDNCNSIIETASNKLLHGCLNTIIPNSVVSIWDYAFSDCYNLSSITIPSSVTYIGYYAFANCSSLTSITIPSSITSISYAAFRYCSNLTSIIVDADNPVYDSRDNCNAIVETASNTLLYGCQNTIIPNTVVSIGDYAFYDCYNLTSITIPSSVTSIGYFSFGYCNNLTSVTIPANLTSIGNYAFGYCSRLALVTSQIEDPFEISDYVFAGVQASMLQVPDGCKAKYEATPGWNQFANIMEFRNIEFADANVKAICVENWDTDGDDELSYAEAVSVTDLGWAFAFNSSIRSFNELQYFTGLTAIGEEAFYNSGIVSVTIPSSVTSIGRDAFGWCYNLSSITIPSGVTSIDLWAFEGCSHLETTIVDSENPVYDSRDNCNAIIETASNTLVLGCQNTIIPNSVTSIGDYAFYGCYNLTSVTIPSSVTRIGYCAFADCNNLTSITIPSSVTSIGYNAIGGCNSLTSIIVDSDNPVYDSRDNCNAIIETASNTLLSGCQNTIIPNTVVSIWDYAFNDCGNLSSITIPSSVTYIGYYAFGNCSSLTSITIPSSITSISYAAFRDCYNLTSIIVDGDNPVYDSRDNCNAIIETASNTLLNGCQNTIIPNTVVSIGDYAFYDCYKLTSVTIPSSVTSIGYYAFGFCNNLTSVTIPANLTSIGNYAFGYCSRLALVTSQIEDPFEISNNVFMGVQASTLQVPDGCKAKYEATPGWSRFANIIEMRNIIFADANVKAVCVANWDTDGDGELSYTEAASVTDLGTVFTYNSSIRSFDELRYFTGLTTIRENAFFNSRIASVSIPSSVTSIGSEAFSWCYYLSSITIPSGVTNIGFCAFRGCPRLETIIVDSENPVYDSRDNCNAIIETASNTLVLGCQNTIIPNSVTSIGDYAFYYCYNLTSVTIPSSITSIGYGAFRYCYNLTSIVVDADNPVYDSRDNCDAIIETASNTLLYGCQYTIIPNTVVSIWDYAFSDCYYLTSITIPSSVTSIGYYAFDNCSSLTSISIPSSVTDIKTGAFENCSYLTSIIVDADNSVYDSRDNCNAIVETASNMLLYGCQNTIIPNTVVSIGDYAFYDCYNLTSITIPSSVTSIGYYSFGYCNNLISVTIPSGVANIGNYAFYGCYNLTSVTIPASVTSIGEAAFMYSGLNEIISLIKDPFEISNDVFEGVQTSTLYVPYFCKEKYESTAGWNSFQNIEELESLMPQPGDDITEYLVNPRFEDGESGWTVVAAAGSGANGREGNVRPGGSSSNLCYEAWNSSSFDIYQIVDRAPIGVYEIEVQGFYRYQRGNAAWNAYQLQESPYVKKGGVPVYVYMNNNATPFVNVFDEPVEYGALYSNSAYDDTYTDPNYEYWYPNAMNSSAEAFSAGMFKQSAFGLVARDGDALRLGVKGASNQGGDSWVIWDNFKLTYRGFAPEVIRPVLETAMAEASEYLGLLMGKTEYADLTAALAEAEQGIAENDGETMLEALNALYDAKDPAHVSKDIFLEQEVAADTMRLAQAIRDREDDKLSQATLDNAHALLTGIAGNTLYEKEEISQLKADVTDMIERLQYSADVYAWLYETAMEAYEVCYNVGEDTRQGLNSEIGEVSSSIDNSMNDYEAGSLSDDEAWDRAGLLWDQASYLREQIDNYIDAAEWQILRTAYELSNQAGAWSTTWDFTTEKPWRSNLPGVETNDGHVVKLWLGGYNLTGTVPQTLFDLPRLQTADFSSNRLTTLEAAIPAQVTDLWLGNQTIGNVGDLNLSAALSEGIAELLPNIMCYNHSNQSFDSPLSLELSNEANSWWMDVYVDNSGVMSLGYMSSPYREENGATLNVESYNDNSKFSVSFYFDEGDTNIDGQVNVLDLQTSINYIFLRNGSNKFNFTAADLWKDQKINVQDVVKLVDRLMAAEDDDEPVAGSRLDSPLTAEASVYVANGMLVINSSKPVAAFDLVINTESGLKLSEQLREMGITCRMDQRPSGIRLIGYSMSGKTLPAGETILGRTGSADANVQRALLADEEAKAVSVGTGSGHATGIEPLADRDLDGDAYDLQGRKIAPQRQTLRGKRSGVVIKNGQKIIK